MAGSFYFNYFNGPSIILAPGSNIQLSQLQYHKTLKLMEPQKTAPKKKVKNKNWNANPQPQQSHPHPQPTISAPVVKQSRYRNISQLAQKYSCNIQAVLGSGYASTVYLGTRNDNQELVCVKAIDLLALGFAPSHIDLIHKQIEFLNKFKSEHIVQLYDVYESGTFYYLVMELCPGGDLYKMLKMSPIDLPTHFISAIIRQIVQGLAEIHEKGIIHRDLKTENIFILKFPQAEVQQIRVKIGDLGFCISEQEVKALKEQGKAPQNVGSPIYMSPEICQQQRYSYSSDVYALGIIWYELYHKKAPWQALTESQLLQKKLKNPAEVWRSDIDANIKQMITQCISNDPESRPQCKQILNFLDEIGKK